MTELTDKMEVEIRELNHLSKACLTLGLHDLADKLACSAVELNNISHDFKVTVVKDLDQRYKQAQQFSATVLEATLTGIALGKEAPNEASNR